VAKRGIFDNTELDPQARAERWIDENPEPPDPGPEPDKKIEEKSSLPTMLNPFNLLSKQVANPRWPEWKARKNTYDAWEQTYDQHLSLLEELRYSKT
jgi:hypothetical protein